MSIYITKDGKRGLAPYSYKKTLLKAGSCFADATIAWLEGADIQMKSDITGFSSCGGAINTNTGIIFTRENLQEILDNLPEGGVLKVAGCNKLVLSEGDKYNKSDKTVKESFAHDNIMVQCNATTFAPGEESRAEWEIQESERQEIESRTPKIMTLLEFFNLPEGSEVYVTNVGVKNYERFRVKVNKSRDKREVTSITLSSTTTNMKILVKNRKRIAPDDTHYYIHFFSTHSGQEVTSTYFYTAPENAIEEFRAY